MPRTIRLALACAVLAAVCGAAATARAEAGVTVHLTANRVTKLMGRDVLAPAETARPGETLEYRAVYRNEGPREARSFLATLPIPRGTSYLPGSAAPGKVEASLDGRTFALVPLTRVVKGPDGRDVVREIPVAEYRALRWSLGSLGIHQARAVTARVRVQTSEVAALTH